PRPGRVYRVGRVPVPPAPPGDASLGPGGDVRGLRVLSPAGPRPDLTVPAAVGGAGRRPRASPVAPEPPADGRPPALPVSGVHRVHRPVRLRPGRPVVGAALRPVDPADPPVDADRLDLPHDRPGPRSAVVLRGPGMGRLLGVGPRGERGAPTVAH